MQREAIEDLSTEFGTTYIEMDKIKLSEKRVQFANGKINHRFITAKARLKTLLQALWLKS